MSDKPITIKVTDTEHLIAMGMALGYITAVEELEKVAIGEKLPGFGYALAKLQALEARHRANTAGKNLRLCFKHGVDLERFNIMWKGGGEVIAEPIALDKPERTSDNATAAQSE